MAAAIDPVRYEKHLYVRVDTTTARWPFRDGSVAELNGFLPRLRIGDAWADSSDGTLLFFMTIIRNAEALTADNQRKHI